MNPNINRHALLDVPAVAELLAVTPRTLTYWRAQNRGPAYIKMDKTIRYRVADVLKWQRAQRINPQAE